MYGCIYKTISIYKAVFTGGIYKARYVFAMLFTTNKTKNNNINKMSIY